MSFFDKAQYNKALFNKALFNNAPLAGAVAEYIGKDRLRGHMPGHKGRPEANGLLARWGELAAWDVTEAEELDDLHAPDGVIAEAQELLAKAVGAKRAFFLVNGASVGILASLQAACKALRAERPELKAEDVRIVLPRNAHRSAWNGLALAGCTPVWLPVTKMAASPGLTLGVEPCQLETVLAAQSNVAAVFLVYPSYYGVCVDLAKMLEICRKNRVASVVDEAHGAHLAFIERSRSAVGLGADLVINSWHKSMGSLGQSAVLLVNEGGCRLPVGRWLSLLQTTSPSYPLLASLDAARAEWSRFADKRAEALGLMRKRLRELAGELGLLRLFEGAMLPPGFGYDDTKALFYSRAGHSGWQIGAALRQAGVEPELADWHFVLLLLSYADMNFADEDFAAWERAMRQAEAILSREPAQAKLELAREPELAEQALPPGEALNRRATYLPLAECTGRIAAGLLTPYPPGIPWVGPGERISSEIVEGLLAVLAGGGRVQGLHGKKNNEMLAAVLV